MIVSNGTETFRIFRDPDPESPREWSNPGTFLVWSGDYVSPDKNPYEGPDDLWRALVNAHLDTDAKRDALTKRVIEAGLDSPRILGEIAEGPDSIFMAASWYESAFSDLVMQAVVDDGVVILPVYMLDHGGVSYSVGSFNDPWDSGQVGYIYMDPTSPAVEACYGKDNMPDRELAVKELAGEVEDYDNYVNGRVYVVEDFSRDPYRADNDTSLSDIYPGHGINEGDEFAFAENILCNADAGGEIWEGLGTPDLKLADDVIIEWSVDNYDDVPAFLAENFPEKWVTKEIVVSVPRVMSTKDTLAVLDEADARQTHGKDGVTSKGLTH